MKGRMNLQWTACVLLALVIGDTAPAQQSDATNGTFVDTLVVQGPVAALPTAPPALVAREMPARRVELPATVAPAEHLADANRRRSDLTADGIVDHRDLAAVTAALGPCPQEPTACSGDVNRDGTVDDADQVIVRQQLGENVSGSVDAFPDRVGYFLPAPPNLLPPFPAQGRADGWRVARLELHSAKANGLRLQLTDLAGTKGLELRVYEPGGPGVFGPYSDPRRGEDGTWWTPIVFGDAIGIELAMAPGSDMPRVMPSITGIMYLFCDGVQCHSGPGSPMACHNDITCNASWADGDGRGVALIYFNSGGGCSRCSGALLNRGPGDFSPLFMTANHCINTQAEADTVEVFWHYNTPTCNGTPPAYNTLLRSDGAILLKRHPGADCSLLGLLEAPQTDTYLGWDPNNWGSGDAATGIHHPRGTFKRISTGTSAGATDGVLFCDPSIGTVPCMCNGGLCISVDVFNVSFSSGTTEPGSSGSPAFDSSRRVRGALTGGTVGCAPVTAQYGRFDRAFANLRYFLNDTDIPVGVVFVNGSVGGDPRNAGSSERGTAANPFNAVAEASFCVRTGQEVRITPGVYNERFTIRRPMTLTRNGSSGTVKIGT